MNLSMCNTNIVPSIVHIVDCIVYSVYCVCCDGVLSIAYCTVHCALCICVPVQVYGVDLIDYVVHCMFSIRIFAYCRLSIVCDRV